MAGSVELWGETFALHPDGVSDYAMMEFAALSSNDDDTPVAMAVQMRAMYRLVDDTLAPEDRARFHASARKNRAKIPELMKVVAAAGERAADRPTELPTDSSPGQPDIAPRSESVFEKAERLSPGRPDLVAAPARAGLMAV